jgi:hypothetical protein
MCVGGQWCVCLARNTSGPRPISEVRLRGERLAEELIDGNVAGVGRNSRPPP